MSVVSSSDGHNRDASAIENNDESDSNREDSDDDSLSSAQSTSGTNLTLSPESKIRLKYITTNNSVTITVKSKCTVEQVVPQWLSESSESSSDSEANTSIANSLLRRISIESVDNNSSSVLEQLRAFHDVTITPIGDGAKSDDEYDDDSFDLEAKRAQLRSAIDISKHPRVLRANIGFSESSEFNKQKVTIDMFFLSGNKASRKDLLPCERIYMCQVSKDQMSLAMQTENDIHCTLLVLPYQLGPGPETQEINKKRLLTNMDIFSSFINSELSEGEMEFHSATNTHHNFFFPPCNSVDKKIKEVLPDLVPCLSDIPYAYFVIKKAVESKQELSSTRRGKGG